MAAERCSSLFGVWQRSIEPAVGVDAEVPISLAFFCGFCPTGDGVILCTDKLDKVGRICVCLSVVTLVMSMFTPC